MMEAVSVLYEVPSCAWSMSLNARPTRPGKRSGIPPLRTILPMIPSLMRLRRIAKLAEAGLEPPLCFRFLDPVDDGWNQGLPIGGLGAGSIGRSFTGDFVRWHLDIGRHEYRSSLPDQFHLRVERESDMQLQTLSLQRTPKEQLTAWAWGMNGARAKYYALFPRAWTEYDFSEWGLQAACEQMSPFIAHNYVESSFPVGVFAWRLKNTQDQPLRASLMFTWENAVSPSRSPMLKDYVRVDDTTANRVLVELGHERTDDVYPISFGIGVTGDPDCHITHNTRFRPDGDGSDVWRDFSKSGQLREPDTPIERRTEPHRTGAALCAAVTIPAHETREIVFSLSWDIPIMRFGSGREWYRRYTRFFDTSGDNATKIAALALDRWRDWERSVIDWQRPILESDNRPDWLKSALFNELYYLLDGGTAWETGDVDAGLSREGIGHFAYLECFDYLFYNTYDVHFYTWALAMNFPELEKSIQRDFADAVLMEDPTVRQHIFDGENAPRKPMGAVPHDMGSPAEDPWIKVNAYRAQNVGRWKDLNSKFVLQVYRVYHLTQDRGVLEYCWPAVKRAMEYMDMFDRDGDGLVENDGVPDQTYDAWVMSGPSAYCCILYLAACEAMIRMSNEMDEPDMAHKYTDILERGRKSLLERLWNGRYFNYDTSAGKHSDSIMADQLAGHWYALALGLEPVVEHEKARTALRTIFDYNVMRLNQGRMGAVNGMRPNGEIDRTSIQSAEVWTGTTYALAALMLHEGMTDEAFTTTEGVYLATYHDLGYWFRTPEAWTSKGHFRASMYMRPLAVWAIEHALRMRELVKT